MQPSGQSNDRAMKVIKAQRRPLSKLQLNTLDAAARMVKGGLKSTAGSVPSKLPPQNNTSGSVQNREYNEGKAKKSGDLVGPLTLRASNGPKKLSIEDFEIGKSLGKGKLGMVYCARHKATGYICALKVMSKHELTNLKLENNFKREIEIQSSLFHCNISRLYGFFYDSDHVYLILEYAVNGELYHQLKTQRKLNDITASHYIFQVTHALIYLHSKNIIHRDIKPENILVSSDNQIKLSDFGWSVRQSNHSRRLTICGTLDYLPPEMIESSEHDQNVDVWALGVLCYELLVGKPPFEEVDKNATYKRIAKVDLRFPSYISAEAVDLIRKLLQKNPKKRIRLSDVLHHPWLLKHRTAWPLERKE